MLYSLVTRFGINILRIKMLIIYGLLDSHHVFKVNNKYSRKVCIITTYNIISILKEFYSIFNFKITHND